MTDVAPRADLTLQQGRQLPIDPNRHTAPEARFTEAEGDIPDEIPVLIVGGGPVGLVTSMLLSRHGIRSLLVERHSGTAIQPKARYINARTMEIFRGLGIEQNIHNVAIPHTRNVIWARSLADEEILRLPVETMIPETARDWSPTWGCTSTQEIFEPVLLAQARLLAQAQIHFNTELLSFEQREDCVIARLLHRQNGRISEVRAQYLIGADGAHSRVREGLGIRMQGQPVLSHFINIHFRADLARWVGDREINVCFVTDPRAVGLLMPDGEDRWRFTAFCSPDKGQHPEDYTAERSVEVVRMAVGVPDLPVQLRGIFPWSDAALLAERFYEGRVFLVGDAEHLVSPAGGFGMNIGIQSAHNLTWKLAAVLKGWAAPALLASYEAERAPISRQAAEYLGGGGLSSRQANRDTLASSPSEVAPRPLPGRSDFFRGHGLVFGATYESSSITPDGAAPVQVANPVTEYIQNARPGSRAPHVWLQGHEHDSTGISTIDLFGRDPVLLTGAGGQAWCATAYQIARVLGVPVRTYRVAPDGDLSDVDNAWADAYGVQSDGAVLVRPDGYVAWRRRTTDQVDLQTELEQAIKRALGYE